MSKLITKLPSPAHALSSINVMKPVKHVGHLWGDKWRYWNMLGRAMGDFSALAHKARLGGDIKEKWGTLRFYVKFHHQLHDLFYPGYAYCQWPTWLWWLDCRIYCQPLFDPIRWFIVKRQYKQYRAIYSAIIAKYPKIRNEILCVTDYPELLEGL